eukprot:Nk52_evm20s1837 gene=Nk52_evmTU20s1837
MTAKSLITITLLISTAMHVAAAPGESGNKVPIVQDRSYSVGVGCAPAYSEVDSEGRSNLKIDLHEIVDDVWFNVPLPSIAGVTTENITETISVYIEKNSCKDKAECRGHIDINLSSYMHHRWSSDFDYVFATTESISGTVGNETMNPARSGTLYIYEMDGAEVSAMSAFDFIKSFNSTPFLDLSNLNEIFFKVSLNDKLPILGPISFPKGGCSSLVTNGTQVILGKMQATTSSPSTGPPNNANSADSTAVSLFLSLFVPTSFLVLFA